MARSEPSLEELYANLALEDEDAGGIIVGNSDVIEAKHSHVLVGKFLTEKNINFSAMQNVMASLWRPNEGMEVYDLGGFGYSFVFYHKMDLQKVLDGGPWSFEQAMLVLYQLKAEEDPNTVQLNEFEIWVQVYDLPRGFISENILKTVGASIGRYVKSDPKNFDGLWKSFVRIRVAMNVDKPLKRRMKIKREGDKWGWINFKYERLGTFCFVCGFIGHSERECNIVYANSDKVIDRAYGSWLRAPPKMSKQTAGSRWLRSAGTYEYTGSKEQGLGESSVAVHGGGSSTEQGRFMEVEGVMREIEGDTGGITVKS